MENEAPYNIRDIKIRGNVNPDLGLDTATFLGHPPFKNIQGVLDSELILDKMMTFQVKIVHATHQPRTYFECQQNVVQNQSGNCVFEVDVMLDLPALPVKICGCVVLRPCRTLLGTEFHSLHLLTKVEETTFWDCNEQRPTVLQIDSSLLAHQHLRQSRLYTTEKT